MKPTKLELQAFGPYKDNTIIDFSQFTDSSLFLLTGETGSGKTMIFDALTFALFGRTSGNGRGIDSVRSQLALPHIMTYVKLTFIHQGSEYSIFRNPTHVYAKKKGGKETTVSHFAELYLPNGDIVAAVTEVNLKVESILGLDYDQFKQIALIGQGEFRELLSAKSSARSDIFRKIFNTKLYQDFENKLRDMNATAKAEYDKEKLLIEKVQSDIGLENANVDSLSDSIVALSNVIKADEKAKIIIAKQKEDVTKSIAKLVKTIEIEKQVIRDFKELDVSRTLLVKLADKQEVIDKVASDLVLFNNAQIYIKPIATKLSEAKIRFDLSVLNERNTKKSLAEMETQLKDLEEKKAVLDSQSEAIALLKQENHTISKSLEDYKALSSYLQAFDVGNHTLLADSNNLELINTKLLKLEVQITELETASKVKVETEGRLVKVAAEYDKLAELMKLTKSLEEISALEQIEAKALADLSERVRILSAEHIDKQHEFYMSQAGYLAKGLKDEEPCPVCGSKHHPNKAVLSDIAVSKDMLDDMVARLANENETLHDLGNKHAQIMGRVNEIKKLYASKSIGFEDKDISELFSNVSIQMEKARLVLSKLEDVDGQLEIAKNLLSEMRVTKEALTKSINETRISIEGIKTNIAALQRNLKYQSYELAHSTLQNGINTVSDYDKSVTSLAASIRDSSALHASTQGSLRVIEKSIEDEGIGVGLLEKEFASALQSYGIESKEIYEGILALDKDSCEEMIRLYNTEKTEVGTIIKSLEAKLKGKEIPNIDVLELEVEQANINLEALDKQLQELAIKINRFSHSVNELVVRGSDFDKKREVYQSINILYRTASGNLTQKDRISFEYYVQSAYFSKVIVEANKRLDIMTQSRYQLMLRQKSFDKRISSGLDLDVIDHHSNKVREVSTLSGGESFKAALSLALGMSDVIQIFAGGIEIDMLFVDEGFGSLDQQSLDQAMNVLNSLTTSNRMIGIISHVSELKTRIEQQIVVKKDVSGSSISIIS